MKILLGITGSIAAYKSAFLVRLLVKSGHEVKVIMTESAQRFIAPLTLSTLSQNPVLSQFERDETGVWNNHVELGLWADRMLIAPCSANTLSKMATGLCDNLLMATYLSARCPVAVAPAMDLDMWTHPSTVQNMETLKKWGLQVLEPGTGELASGLSGKGRMAEPEEIVRFLEDQNYKPLKGKIALITAGPTHEHLDPVRFISNASSGKMGLALADELHRLGAEVILVHGPIPTSDKPYRKIAVTSAEQMAQTTLELYPKAHIAVFAAAVSDYTPEKTASQKIKKKESYFELKLVKTTDIAYQAGLLKTQNQINIGFALETENEEANGIEKLHKKNFDLLVLNSLNDSGAGFGYDTNKITLITRHQKRAYDLKSKTEVAKDIVSALLELIG
jgi:phosphopantothenoylcysteine decarboxylase/phosphopantothenate--cysteine ligase